MSVEDEEKLRFMREYVFKVSKTKMRYIIVIIWHSSTLIYFM